jgi:radical SAM superfamily enzyme YgiQ (UPF0313 family)
VKWTPYQHNGQIFDLSHLDDFEYIFVQAATNGNPARQYVVLVTFTDHPFTDSSNEDAMPIYRKTQSREGVKHRYFNHKRWWLSKWLPELIKAFGDVNKKFYVLADGAYFRLEFFNEANQKIEYDIFFDLVKEKQRLVMVVKSAYERDPNSNERPQMDRNNNFGFFKLLHATSQGKRIHRRY